MSTENISLMRASSDYDGWDPSSIFSNGNSGNISRDSMNGKSDDEVVDEGRGSHKSSAQVKKHLLKGSTSHHIDRSDNAAESKKVRNRGDQINADLNIATAVHLLSPRDNHGHPEKQEEEQEVIEVTEEGDEREEEEAEEDDEHKLQPYEGTCKDEQDDQRPPNRKTFSNQDFIMSEKKLLDKREEGNQSEKMHNFNVELAHQEQQQERPIDEVSRDAQQEQKKILSYGKSPKMNERRASQGQTLVVPLDMQCIDSNEGRVQMSMMDGGMKGGVEDEKLKETDEREMQGEIMLENRQLLKSQVEMEISKVKNDKLSKPNQLKIALSEDRINGREQVKDQEDKRQKVILAAAATTTTAVVVVAVAAVAARQQSVNNETKLVMQQGVQKMQEEQWEEEQEEEERIRIEEEAKIEREREEREEEEEEERMRTEEEATIKGGEEGEERMRMEGEATIERGRGGREKEGAPSDISRVILRDTATENLEQDEGRRVEEKEIVELERSKQKVLSAAAATTTTAVVLVAVASISAKQSASKTLGIGKEVTSRGDVEEKKESVRDPLRSQGIRTEIVENMNNGDRNFESPGEEDEYYEERMEIGRQIEEEEEEGAELEEQDVLEDSLQESVVEAGREYGKERMEAEARDGRQSGHGGSPPSESRNGNTDSLFDSLNGGVDSLNCTVIPSREVVRKSTEEDEVGEHDGVQQQEEEEEEGEEEEEEEEVRDDEITEELEISELDSSEVKKFIGSKNIRPPSSGIAEEESAARTVQRMYRGVQGR